jgi:hypothetical protein
VEYPRAAAPDTTFYLAIPIPETQIPRHDASMPGDLCLGTGASTHRLFTLCRWIAQTHLLILHRLNNLIPPFVLDYFVREQRAFGEHVIVNV